MKIALIGICAFLSLPFTNSGHGQDNGLYVGPAPLDYAMLEINVRLWSPYPGQEPARFTGLTARVAIDDIAVINEDQP